jgi:thioredoxin 1
MIKIIHFYADWCQDCEIQNNILEQMAMEYDDVSIELVNVDYQEAKAKKYEIINLPTLVIADGDETITRIEGVVDLEDLEEVIDMLTEDFVGDEEAFDEFM